MACDPAQDSANLVQALAAVVNTCTNESNPAKWSITIRAAHRGGTTGAFCPGPQPERDPRRPHEGPPEYLFKRSIYSNRAVRSKYSNRAVTVFFREQCSKLIDKEIWLVMGSYCHFQQVVTFFFFSFFFFFFDLHLTTWVKGPTLTLCPGPLNFSGRP